MVVSGLNEQFNTSVYSGSIASGSRNLNAASGTFTTADVGRMVAVTGAGVSGGVLSTYISSYVSSSQVQLHDAASITTSSTPFTKAVTNRGDLGNRDTYITYYSCSVRSTMQRLSGFAPISNGWVDNWAS